MTERSKYQQSVIRNYYQNRDAIALQRAQEIVTELYLSEGKKREKYWKSLANHLLKLEVKQEPKIRTRGRSGRCHAPAAVKEPQEVSQAQEEE